MRDINVQWGQRQGMMLTVGTLADAGDVRMVFDVTAVEADSPGAAYGVRIRRADAVVIQAAQGLEVDADMKVSYTLQLEDLGAPGALWITLIMSATGSARKEWTFLGWVAAAAYDGSYGAPGPLWAEALLAMLYAGNGVNDAPVGGASGS
jgi:hypothetical protein